MKSNREQKTVSWVAFIGSILFAFLVNAYASPENAEKYICYYTETTPPASAQTNAENAPVNQSLSIESASEFNLEDQKWSFRQFAKSIVDMLKYLWNIVCIGEGQLISHALLAVSYILVCVAFLKTYVRNVVEKQNNRDKNFIKEIKNIRLHEAFMIGRTELAFQNVYGTSTVRGVKQAIDYCWRLHDWGRVPLFTNMQYRILISNQDGETKYFTDHVLGDCELRKTFGEWNWLRVDQIKEHKIDIDIVDGYFTPTYGSGETRKPDFFDISGQSPEDLVRKIFTPIVVMPYDDLADNRDIWEELNYFISFPVIRSVIEKISNKSISEQDQNSLRGLRAFNWIGPISKSLKDRSGANYDFINTDGNFRDIIIQGGSRKYINDELDGSSSISIVSTGGSVYAGFMNKIGNLGGPIRARGVVLSYIALKDCRGIYSNFVRIPYCSLFDNEGRLDECALKLFKLCYKNVPDDLFKWLENSHEKRGAILGFYFPVLSDARFQEDFRKLREAPSNMSEAKYISCFGMLNIHSAINDGNEIYSQQDFEFGPEKTSSVEEIQVHLQGNLCFKSYPVISIYSLHPYTPEIIGAVEEKVPISG